MYFLLIYPGEPTTPPPAPETAEYYAFFSILGRAIAAWQMVEGILFIIFRELVRPGPLEGARPLSAAFHTAPSFRGRLDMTNAAAKEAMPENLFEEWKKLYTRTIYRAKRRNVVAHSVVAFEPFAKPPRARLYIRPNVVDAKRSPPLPLEINQKEIIKIKELTEMGASFEALHEDLLQFYLKMRPA
jgi:hypothetical protein